MILLLHLVLIALLLAEPSGALAHEIGVPHTDAAPAEGEDGGSAPSTLVILLGVAFTLVTVAVLVWLKNHDFDADDDASGAEPAG